MADKLSLLVLAFAVIPIILLGAEDGHVLVKEYQRAHESRNIEALKELVYWEGATERTNEIIEQRLTRYLDLEIQHIEFRPLTGDEKFEQAGYRPNLDPAGWLTIFFKPPERDSRFFAKSFVVGEKDGKYLIAAAKSVQ